MEQKSKNQVEADVNQEVTQDLGREIGSSLFLTFALICR
jgi:hypothetical protein